MSHTADFNPQVGDRIDFGRFYITSSEYREPIGWRVIDRQDDRILLVTEQVIDWIAFHDVPSGIVWRDSAARKWAKAFFEDAFSDQEKRQILFTEVLTSEERAYDEDDVVDIRDTGIATQDRVFFLSAYEANRYFSDDDDRRAHPTPWAVKRGGYFNESCSGTGWWLRNRGYQISYASDVLPNGEICVTGEEVYESGGVRPAVWVTLP